jgi:hypothetical protein
MREGVGAQEASKLKTADENHQAKFEVFDGRRDVLVDALIKIRVLWNIIASTLKMEAERYSETSVTI